MYKIHRENIIENKTILKTISYFILVHALKISVKKIV